MKKFMIIVAALFVTFALAACNSNGPAALTQPEIADEYEIYDEDGYVYCNPDDFGDDIWNDSNSGAFGSWTGTVVEIDVEYSYPPTTFFRLEGEHGNATFVADFNTFTLGEAPQVGDTVTGYFLNDMPMAMIYPPQYNVSVIVNGDFLGVAVDRFDENLLSYGGNLKLNIGDDTEIVLQNGDPIGADELAHRKLVAVYTVTTRSMPPIATPEKIVVLFEGFATGPAMLDDWNGWEDPMFDEIIVDGVGLAGVFARSVSDEDSFLTHVPLKAVAGFLGADVNWDQDTGEVTLEGLKGPIAFTVGSNDFDVAGETVTLYHAAMEFYGDVYVPVLFFRDVFGMGSVYSLCGQVIINTEPDDMM